jgi:hypothetical protein
LVIRTVRGEEKDGPPACPGEDITVVELRGNAEKRKEIKNGGEDRRVSPARPGKGMAMIGLKGQENK